MDDILIPLPPEMVMHIARMLVQDSRVKLRHLDRVREIALGENQDDSEVESMVWDVMLEAVRESESERDFLALSQKREKDKIRHKEITSSRKRVPASAAQPLRVCA